MNNSKTPFECASTYPYVDHGSFVDSSILHLDRDQIEVSKDIRITTSPLSRLLKGSAIELPTYDLDLGHGRILKNRIAVMAIGSNSSPNVLVTKFRDSKNQVGGIVPVIQATLDHHASVHGGTLGETGSIPATIVPHKDSSLSITVSFLEMDRFGTAPKSQLECLTGTEAYYDQVHLPDALASRGLTTNPVIAHGALAFVSPWRALSRDGINPLALAALPQKTSLEIITGAEAAQLVTDKLRPGLSAKEFFNHHLDRSLKSRLTLNELLPLTQGPVQIRGTRIIGATHCDKAREFGLAVPSINYI